MSEPMLDTMAQAELIEEKLAAEQGSKLFKGLDHLAETPEFKRWAGDEFPERQGLGQVDRRSFLKYMGASLAVAGLAGCRYLPQRKLVPHVQAPESYLPGTYKQYATAVSRGGYATGVVATTHEGRPIRLDGNTKHPASLGALDSQSQAELLNLYDPDRLQQVQFRGDIGTWQEFSRSALQALDELKSSRGAGVVLLTDKVGSPTLAKQIGDFLAQHPRAKWFQYEPVHRDHVFEGAQLAYNEVLETRYALGEADVVVSLDSSLFRDMPGSLRYSREVMSRRNLRERKEMNRLYAFESHPTEFGAVSDHRYPVRTSQILAVALAIAARVGVAGMPSASLPEGVSQDVIAAVAEDLLSARGSSVVVPGDHLPPQVHAVCHAINDALGNMGRTVIVSAPVLPETRNATADLKEFAQLLESESVKFLLMIGGNPAYDLPADVGFAEKLARIPWTARLGAYLDETSLLSQWQLPESHALEAWSDGVAFDGSQTLVQPMVEPLYDTKSAIEVLDILARRSRPGADIIRQAYLAMSDAQWRLWLAEGVRGEPAPHRAASVSPTFGGAVGSPESPTDYEVLFAPDPTIYDGRYANNGWLQELPKPLTQIAWDNAAYVSYNTAKALGLTLIDNSSKYEGHEVVQVSVGERKFEVPAVVHLGMADGVVLVTLGYGRTAESLQRAVGAGSSAYAVRTTGNQWIAVDARIAKVGRRERLALAQLHHTIEATPVDSNRDIIQSLTFAAWSEGEKPHAPGHTEHVPHPEGFFDRNLYPEEEHDWSDGYNQWAMTVDLNLCIGCNACVTACQAENNIPVVGKEQVIKGRELHWIRIDRYYATAGNQLENPAIFFQPMTCQHCEQAPCEPVCPVAATIHSHEGLNQMVYNRCVGTRYCSNNCPYKVRRFNFLNYADKHDVPVLKLLNNPDVTVRGRGVMEKCTYCVQRINKARISAKKEGRALKGDEVKTACQIACPTNTILFGDMREEGSVIDASRKDKRNYVVLKDLNTRPRTTYLARVANPNPRLEVKHG